MTYSITHGILLNILYMGKWSEKEWTYMDIYEKEWTYMFMYNWITILYAWNWHNISSQLHSNKT